MASLRMGSMPSLRRQHLLAEFAGLKQACPEGVFVSLTPGDPMLWSGVMFVRHGPYATAILRFQISFPDTYPRLPPLVTFSTDMFHPLITPLTTYMYTTDIQDNGTVSATDAERLPPGGFSLRHGFPAWFGRGSRSVAGSRQASGQQQPPATPARGGTSSSAATTPSSKATPIGGHPGYLDTSRREVSTYEVLRYIRSTFDDDSVLDSVPLEAAGNPGAWHAWRTRQRQAGNVTEESAKRPVEAQEGETEEKKAEGETAAADGQDKAEQPVPEAEPAAPATPVANTIKRKPVSGVVPTPRHPGEWNWDGVWEDRVQKGIAASLSEAVLYGAASGGDDLINFLAMEEGEVDSVRENLQRTLGSGAATPEERNIFPDTDDVVGDDTIRASYDGNDQIAPLSSCGPSFSDPFSARMPTRDPAVLVPRIVVTPAVRAIEGDRGAMWIAVEVSAELCQPPDGTFLPMTPVSNNGFPVPGTEPRQLGDRYGCIYDMDIQLIPLGNNCILEIIQEDEPTPSMLFPGLKVLVLAHVHFEAKGPIPFRPNGHIRQRSDELIDDLEDQLGSSRVEYLRIVVKYKHSAFPKCGRSDTVDGVADVETKLETSATAALQHLNHRSLWSPCAMLAPNPLFGIIHQHWP
ncbi:Protein crossbronx-like protein [Colletotrichum viniferum]|nr:Protein crossbronx-like protein [Colletotrichum viniferum]